MNTITAAKVGDVRAFEWVSAFSGIGGFEKGAERAGGTRCVAQVEINKHRQKLLARHWPELLKGENIDDVRGRDLARADALIAGFPCQDTSIGSPFRRGLEGERSGKYWEFRRLIEEYLRLVEETDARWVAIENPDGLTRSPGKVNLCTRCTGICANTAKHCPRCREDGVLTRVDRTGWDMATVIRGIRELGYGVHWRVVDAGTVGSAQRRRRLLIVGHRGGDARPAELVLGDTGPGAEAAPPHPVRRRTHRPTAVVGADPVSGGLIFRKSANPRASLALGGYETWVPEGDDGSLNTLAGFDWGNATRQKTLIVYPDGRMRTLTIQEWEMLQGFERDWTAGMPESERGDAIGDAQNVPHAEWFFRRLVAVHNQIPMIPTVKEAVA